MTDYIRPTDTVVDAFGLVRRIWVDLDDQIYAARFDLAASILVETIGIWIKNDGSSGNSLFVNIFPDSGSNSPNTSGTPLAVGSRTWTGSTSLQFVEFNVTLFTSPFSHPAPVPAGLWWVLAFTSTPGRSFDAVLYSVPSTAGANSKFLTGGFWVTYGTSPPQSPSDFGAIDIQLGTTASGTAHGRAFVIG